jgi:hypothetical protein
LLQRDFLWCFFSPFPQEEARREKMRMEDERRREEDSSLEDLSFNGHLDSSLSVSLLER